MPATRTAVAAVQPGLHPSDAAATAADRTIDLAYRDILLNRAEGPMNTTILPVEAGRILTLSLSRLFVYGYILIRYCGGCKTGDWEL
jgi:hypothetical protein